MHIGNGNHLRVPCAPLMCYVSIVARAQTWRNTAVFYSKKFNLLKNRNFVDWIIFACSYIANFMITSVTEHTQS